MPYQVVVPVSGGKDSQCCLKLAAEEYGPDNVLGLFCDTRFEHPKTYRHVDWMEEHYGVWIIRISAGSVDDKVLKYSRFPGGGARHCTDELKIRPAKIFYQSFAEELERGFEVWYGMRFAESSARRTRYREKVDTDLYPPHEVMRKYPKKLEKLGVMFRLPILEWTTPEVFDFLSGEENPLYTDGFSRVGCFPCLAAGDKYKESAFDFDDFGRSQRERVRSLENTIKKPIWTSKSGRRRHSHEYEDGPGCEICSI